MEVKDGQLLQMEEVSVNFAMNIVTNIYGSEGWSIVTNGGGIRKSFSVPALCTTASYTHRAMQTGKHHVTLIIQVLYLSSPWNSFCICICICTFAGQATHTEQGKQENIMSHWLFKYCICLLLQTVFAFVFVFVLLQGKLHTQSYVNRKHHVTLIIQGLYLSFPWNSICIHNSICIFFCRDSHACMQTVENKQENIMSSWLFLCMYLQKENLPGKQKKFGKLFDWYSNRKKHKSREKFDW